MSDVDVDKSNVDAEYWAEKFCETMSEQHWEYEDIDVALMLGWFANYRFAVAGKLEAELAELRKVLKAIATGDMDILPEQMAHEALQEKGE